MPILVTILALVLIVTTKMKNNFKAIAYTRVSTSVQSTLRQATELKNVQGYDVIKVYKEKISGYSKSITERKELQNAIEHVRTDQNIDVIMISEISRLGRNTNEVLSLIEELEKEEIPLYIHNLGCTIGGVDAKEHAFTKLIVTIMADLARLESDQLSARIKSGIKSRKERGLSTGRKTGSKETNEKFLSKHTDIQKYLNKGFSSREIQRQCKCGPGTIQKVKRLIGL